MSSAVSPAISAATVVLLREAPDGWEVLLLERHAGTAFAGGATVFPGGRVEPGDAAIAADPALASGFDTLDPVDAAARVAAAREAFEEADVLLGDGPLIDLPTRAGWRTRLNAGEGAFADFLAVTGTRLDAGAFVPFAHWCPPEEHGLTRRFDTRFYLARVPADTLADADGHEAVTVQWTPPAAALARADAGAISVIFPTRRNLERLAQYPTLDTLWTATAARTPALIQPAIVTRDGGRWLTIPADCDYPVTEEAIGAALRG